MASQKQIEANRRNAQRSTGPKSEDGKLRSRTNALKHGMAALHVPLSHEDATLHEAMLRSLIEKHQPAGLLEEQLVAAIAHAWIRMQRAARFEAATIDGQVRSIKRRTAQPKDPAETDDHWATAALADPEAAQAWHILGRYESRAQSAWYRAVEALRRAQNDRLSRPERECREHIAQSRLQRMREAQAEIAAQAPSASHPVSKPAQTPKLASFGPAPVQTHFEALPQTVRRRNSAPPPPDRSRVTPETRT